MSALDDLAPDQRAALELFVERGVTDDEAISARARAALQALRAMPSPSEAGQQPEDEREEPLEPAEQIGMRLQFGAYVSLVVLGLVFFTIIGLSHN